MIKINNNSTEEMNNEINEYYLNSIVSPIEYRKVEMQNRFNKMLHNVQPIQNVQPINKLGIEADNFVKSRNFGSPRMINSNSNPAGYPYVTSHTRTEIPRRLHAIISPMHSR